MSIKADIILKYLSTADALSNPHDIISPSVIILEKIFYFIDAIIKKSLD